MQDYSDETAVEIDEEVRRIISGGYQRAKSLLADEHRPAAQVMAEQLLEKEVLDGAEIDEIVRSAPRAARQPAELLSAAERTSARVRRGRADGAHATNAQAGWRRGGGARARLTGRRERIPGAQGERRAGRAAMLELLANFRLQDAVDIAHHRVRHLPHHRAHPRHARRAHADRAAASSSSSTCRRSSSTSTRSTGSSTTSSARSCWSSSSSSSTTSAAPSTQVGSRPFFGSEHRARRAGPRGDRPRRGDPGQPPHRRA